MIFLRIFIISLWTLIALPILAFCDELTLQSYLSQVQEANPTVHSSKQRADALKHRIKPSSTLDDPFFAVGPDEIPFKGEMGSVTRFQISQNIPFPGKLGARGEIARGRVKSAEADAQTAERQIIVIATQTFYRAVFNQEAILVNEKIRKIIDSTAQSTKARYRTGDVGHHDWLLARVELSVLNIENLRLDRERRTLIALLNELRDLPPETPIGKLSLALDNQQKADFTQEHSIDHSPELKSLDGLIQSARQEQRLAKLSYFPDFVIQGMVMQPNSSMAESANWGVMVGITLPIFFWRKQSETLSATQLDLASALSEKRSLENRLRTEVVDARQQLKTARDTVELYEKDVIPNTELAVSNARSGYAARKLPLGQLLDALRMQRTQELELAAAKLDLEATKLRLKEVLGSPPILKLAPTRPSLFGAGGMGGQMPAMGTSDNVRMGPGMKVPGQKQKQTPEGDASSMGAGMGGM